MSAEVRDTAAAAPSASNVDLPTPLAIRGARYRYAGARAWAIDGIDLEVAAGEVVGVVGANEAGKSTLCLVAAGLAPAVVGGTLEGAVELVDRETGTLRPDEAAQRAGILFEDAGTQLSGTAPTVWEEVAFGPRNLGLPLADVVERVESSLAAVRIEALAARDPGRLSGGQAQLVALASVLAMRPACLVLDEPTSQLDPHGTALVGAAVARLARQAGTGVLLVEHKTGLLAGLADRILVLDGGRPVLVGPAAEVLADQRLAALGIEPPPAVRLRAALAGARIDEEVGRRAVEAIEAESRSSGAATATEVGG